MLERDETTPGGTRSVHDAAAILAAALHANGGPRDWRLYKESTAQAVVDMAGRAARFRVLAMSLEADLRIVYTVQMPVPRWPVDGKLRVGAGAMFELTYQPQWRCESPPSFLPLSVLEPVDIFHPNCRPVLGAPMMSSMTLAMPRVAICLGDLPPGTPACELILLGYFALSLQDRLLDETDPSGVLNPLACQFYRDHPEHLPLTHGGFYDPCDAAGDDATGDTA